MAKETAPGRQSYLPGGVHVMQLAIKTFKIRYTLYSFITYKQAALFGVEAAQTVGFVNLDICLWKDF